MSVPLNSRQSPSSGGDALRRLLGKPLALAPGADDGDRGLRPADEFRRQLPYPFRRDAVDALDQLGRLYQPVEQQELACHLLGAGRRALQPHQQAGLDLRLGARQLGFGRLLRGGAQQLLADDVDQLLHYLRSGRRVDAEKPRVGQRPTARVDRIAKAAALPHLLEQSRRHPPAEQPGKYLGYVELLAAIRGPGERHDEMALLEGLCRRARATHVACRLESAANAAIEAAELGFSMAHEVGVADVAGG